MFVEAGQTGAFKVDVETTSNGGHPPEFWAKRCIERVIHVAEGAHPAIREQAIAYRDKLEEVILLHMKRAIQSDRTTIGCAVTNAGHAQLADMIRRL